MATVRDDRRHGDCITAGRSEASGERLPDSVFDQCVFTNTHTGYTLLLTYALTVEDIVTHGRFCLVLRIRIKKKELCIGLGLRIRVRVRVRVRVMVRVRG